MKEWKDARIKSAGLFLYCLHFLPDFKGDYIVIGDLTAADLKATIREGLKLKFNMKMWDDFVRTGKRAVYLAMLLTLFTHEEHGGKRPMKMLAHYSKLISLLCLSVRMRWSYLFYWIPARTLSIVVFIILSNHGWNLNEWTLWRLKICILYSRLQRFLKKLSLPELAKCSSEQKRIRNQHQVLCFLPKTECIKNDFVAS